ncbi:hypothetical protein [Sutcliffiella horikoshii]
MTRGRVVWMERMKISVKEEPEQRGLHKGDEDLREARVEAERSS